MLESLRSAPKMPCDYASTITSDKVSFSYILVSGRNLGNKLQLLKISLVRQLYV